MKEVVVQRLPTATPVESSPDTRCSNQAPQTLPGHLFHFVITTIAALALALSTASAGEEAEDVAGLTHFNDGASQQVTYRMPKSVLLTKADVPKGAWTISDPETAVICFEDGNNAVFFTIKGEFYAANGKARQFVDFKGGDGILTKSGKLRRVRDLKLGLHVKLRQIVIDTGLKLCGQKSVGEIAQSVDAGSEVPPMTQKQATMLQAAFGIQGAELCNFELNALAVAAFLIERDIHKQTVEDEMPAYVLIVMKMYADVGKQQFCNDFLLPKFGPGGLKFVSK